MVMGWIAIVVVSALLSMLTSIGFEKMNWGAIGLSFLVLMTGWAVTLCLTYSRKEIESYLKFVSRIKKKSDSENEALQSLQKLGIELLNLGQRAKKEGLLNLERYVTQTDPELIKGVRLVSDGVEHTALHKIMENKISATERELEKMILFFREAYVYLVYFSIVAGLFGLFYAFSRLQSPETALEQGDIKNNIQASLFLSEQITGQFTQSVLSGLWICLVGLFIARLAFVSSLKKVELELEFRQRRQNMIAEALGAISLGMSQNYLKELIQSFFPKKQV